MEEKAKKCIICNIDNSNYKCPKCKNYYCSINCFKEHKEKCITIKGNDNQNNENENLNHDKPLNLDEEEDIILEKKDLDKLKGNQKIINMLKNKSLRKIIREIDGAKYKKRTLERVMKNDKNFKEFIQDILYTLGFIKNGIFTIK